MCCDVFCLPLMCSLILFNFQLICVIGFYLIAWTLSICFQLLHKLCTIMTTVNYTDVQFGCKHFVDLILSTQQLTTDWFCLLITNYFVRWSYGIFNSYNVVIVSVFLALFFSLFAYLFLVRCKNRVIHFYVQPIFIYDGIVDCDVWGVFVCCV